jgi:hypothetical protein
MASSLTLTRQRADNEKQIRQRSLVITASITLLLLLLLFFWVIYQGQTPPDDDIQYELVGSVDFGTSKAGSGTDNTATRPTELNTTTPSPTPKPSQVQPTPVPEPVVTAPKGPVSIPEESKPSQKPPTPEAPKPTETSQQGGQSGQGNDNVAGNAGDPNMPEGMVMEGLGAGPGGSGSGSIGLQCKVCTQLPYPGDFQGVITYIVTVNPNGTVKEVTAEGGNMTATQGGFAIKKWRFTNLTGKETTVKIKVTYKQK